jgi:hypothetical protein
MMWIALAVSLFVPIRGVAAPGLTGAGQAVALTSPIGGESWAVGSRHVLSWDPGGLPVGATVSLSASTDDGETWTAISDAPAEAGSIPWEIPDTVSEACRIRVTTGDRNSQASLSERFNIVPSRAVPDYRWVNVTNRAAFAPRDGAGALVHRGRMWLVGGWNPGDKAHFPRICNNEVWSTADGVDWVLEKPNTFLDDTFDPRSDWEGRHTAGYVVHRGRMWLVGGDVNQGHYQPDVWNSADGRSWTLVNPDEPVPWGPRALHHTVAFKDKIWVLGGQTMPGFAPSEEVFYRDVWNSSDGLRWTRLEPEEPCWSPRGMIGGAAVFRDRIWILGGGTYDTPTTPSRRFFNDVWSSPDGVRWERHVARAPWAPRQYHEVAAFDGRLWVLEGYSGENRNDAWYSDDGVNWYEVPETPWKPRHAASVFVFDEALWMVAGNNMESDVWKLVRTGASADPAP